jgi:hypothetical protein
VVVMMLVADFFVVVMMFVAAFFVVVVVMVMMCVFFKAFKLGLKGILLFHSRKNIFSVELRPNRRDERCRGVMFFQKCDCLGKFFFRNGVRVRKNDRACVLD